MVTMLFMIGSVVLCLGSALADGLIDLPQTGQTKCYDPEKDWEIDCEGSGQDGEFRAGVAWPEPRFVDNNDGTITDNLTGLMWLKVANCFSYKPWQQALDVIAEFNANPENFTCGNYYSGKYDDWVLPNVNELSSLTNSLPELYKWLSNQGFVGVQNANYWTSTTYAGNSNHAWTMNMNNSHLYGNGYSKNNNYYVWPVRAGQ